MKKLVLIILGINRYLILETNTLYFTIGKILFKSTINYIGCGGSLYLLNCIEFESTALMAEKSKV